MATKTDRFADRKDVPLLLRKRRDGTLELNDARGFPPRHEFDLAWLLERTGDGTVVMSSDEIHLNLANGTAVYRIDRDRMEETYVDEDGNEKARKLSTGYWGVLVDEEIV